MNRSLTAQTDIEVQKFVPISRTLFPSAIDIATHYSTCIDAKTPRRDGDAVAGGDRGYLIAFAKVNPNLPPLVLEVLMYQPTYTHGFSCAHLAAFDNARNLFGIQPVVHGQTAQAVSRLKITEKHKHERLLDLDGAFYVTTLASSVQKLLHITNQIAKRQKISVTEVSRNVFCIMLELTQVTLFQNGIDTSYLVCVRNDNDLQIDKGDFMNPQISRRLFNEITNII